MERLKTAFTLLTFILLIVIPASTGFAFPNEPEDFRGIRWETNISQLKRMKILEDGGNFKTYVRDNDKMRMGEVELTRIGYAFYKGRFLAAWVNFNSPSNFAKVKRLLFKRHGRGFQPNRLFEKYIWFSVRMGISLDYNTKTKRGAVTYIFKPLWDEKESEEKKTHAKNHQTD